MVESDENMIELINFLNNNCTINNNLGLNTFKKVALNKGFDLDLSCIHRKCNMSQDEISFALNNIISSYITLPLSLIERNEKYNLGKFKFMSLNYLFENYDKYDNLFDIAYSSSKLNEKMIIFFSCFKRKRKYFFRTETLEQRAKFASQKNINLRFNFVNSFNYGESLLKIKNNQI